MYTEIFFNTYIKFGTRKECDPGPSPGDDETFLDVSLASVESPVYRSRIPFYCFGCELIFVVILRQGRRMDHGLLAPLTRRWVSSGSGGESGDDVTVPDPLCVRCRVQLRERRCIERYTRTRIHTAYSGGGGVIGEGKMNWNGERDKVARSCIENEVRLESFFNLVEKKTRTEE